MIVGMDTSVLCAVIGRQLQVALSLAVSSSAEISATYWVIIHS
jgi:hypothetical protein